MPNYKVNIFFAAPARFTGQVPAGWSETYYLVASDNTQAVLAVDPMVTGRATILANPCTIIGYRISDVDIFKDSYLNLNTLYSYFDITYTADTPWQSYLTDLANGFLYHRSLMIRGIPDVVYNPEGAGEEAGRNAWISAANTFLNDRLKNIFSLRVLSKNPAVAPLVRVVSVTPVGGTELLWTTDNPSLVQVNEFVHFYNLGFTPPLPSLRVTLTPSSTTFRTQFATLPDGWVPEANTKVKRNIYIYPVIDTALLRRVSHRVTGRPFGEQRGKRRSPAR